MASSSITQVSQLAGIPRANLHRIMRRHLHLYPCHFTLLQNITEEDKEQRVTFANWLLDNEEIVPNILWSDEANFSVDGIINKHNCVIWFREAPHEYLTNNHHSPYLCVSQLAGIPRANLHRIMRRHLHLYPCHFTLLQNITEEDKEQRVTFANWLLDNEEIVPNILWSDEANFSVDGIINKHNCVIWFLEKREHILWTRTNHLRQDIRQHFEGTAECEVKISIHRTGSDKYSSYETTNSVLITSLTKQKKDKRFVELLVNSFLGRGCFDQETNQLTDKSRVVFTPIQFVRLSVKLRIEGDTDEINRQSNSLRLKFVTLTFMPTIFGWQYRVNNFSFNYDPFWCTFYTKLDSQQQSESGTKKQAVLRTFYVKCSRDGWSVGFNAINSPYFQLMRRYEATGKLMKSEVNCWSRQSNKVGVEESLTRQLESGFSAVERGFPLKNVSSIGSCAGYATYLVCRIIVFRAEFRVAESEKWPTLDLAEGHERDL
ncbi:hypothetical protein CLF_109389 [Clonorchis sinensis]|uniref:Uncharacterized protein n=1 Tax=Clonorchis sinensis TaxID=79923 RepID=G7YJA4_CLOSI|nr:hypothetical protein CLF_109389 [Clonorchis sinensis]